MASKVLRNSDLLVNRALYYGGVLQNSYTSLMRDYANAEATFKRKKPSPLNVTRFTVTEYVENQEVYERGSDAPYMYRRVGDIAYVFNTSVLKTDRFDTDGNFNLNRARHKLSGQGQDLGETLAELDQTVKLVRKNLSRLSNIGSSLKAGEWSKLSSLIKGDVPNSVKRMKPSKRLASGYLEVMFGILPLMSSVHTAVNAYGNGILTKGHKVSKVSGTKRLDLSKTFDPSQLSNLGRATISGTVKNPNIATLNQYGLLNPAMMAWQRLPYSFVIDWFLPIGTILGSLTAEAGLEGVLQSRTAVRYSHSYVPAGTVSQRVVYDRYGVTGPVIGNPFGRGSMLNLGKLVSLIALTRQRFS